MRAWGRHPQQLGLLGGESLRSNLAVVGLSGDVELREHPPSEEVDDEVDVVVVWHPVPGLLGSHVPEPTGEGFPDCPCRGPTSADSRASRTPARTRHTGPRRNRAHQVDDDVLAAPPLVSHTVWPRDPDAAAVDLDDDDPGAGHEDDGIARGPTPPC